MDEDRQKELFEDRYAKKLGQTYEEWQEDSPATEDEAFVRLQDIDLELKQTKEELADANGAEKDILEDYRDRLRIEYELLEEMFGLDLEGR